MTRASIGQFRLILAVLLLASLAHAEAKPRSRNCQILDNQLVPAYQVGLRVVPESDVAGYGGTSLTEIEMASLLAYYRLSLGELDLSLQSLFVIVGDRTFLDLPDLLGTVALDAVWTLRRNDSALQIKLAPGIYSDSGALDGNSFNVPFTIASIHVLNRDMSGIVGVQIWPGFETVFVPVIGVEWAIHDALRLKAQIPESRLDWFVTRWLQTTLGCEWRPMGFWLHDAQEADRNYVELNDIGAYTRITCHISEDLFVRGDVGYMFERKISFKNGVNDLPAEAEIENAYYFGLGLGGPF